MRRTKNRTAGFRKTLLAVSISTAIGTPNILLAQEDLEEIQVNGAGIRQTDGMAAPHQ